MQTFNLVEFLDFRECIPGNFCFFSNNVIALLTATFSKNNKLPMTGLTYLSTQKQSSSGVLKKTCSGNMQQIYSRTSLPKSDFNRVALQVY